MAGKGRGFLEEDLYVNWLVKTGQLLRCDFYDRI